VRSVRSYQVRSFEVFVAQVSGDEGRSVVFSSVPAEADRQQQQLRGVLYRLGATPSTPVTILSDGADGPRSLGEAACIGPTNHTLDWFHLAMRIQHVAQAAKGWPADTPGEREDGERLAEAVEQAVWELRRQVEKMLNAHPRVGDFLNKPAADQLAAAPEQPDATQELVSTDGPGAGEEAQAATVRGSAGRAAARLAAVRAGGRPPVTRLVST